MCKSKWNRKQIMKTDYSKIIRTRIPPLLIFYKAISNIHLAQGQQKNDPADPLHYITTPKL